MGLINNKIFDKKIVITNDLIVEQFKNILTKIDHQIISVGSGNGVQEHYLSVVLKRSIICVDPDPESFEPYPDTGFFQIPDYDDVKLLIKFKPELINNCILFLNWPAPNNSFYDIEAIELLKPKGILLIYESLGGAGGSKLQKWIQQIGGPSKNWYLFSKQNLKNNKYYIDQVQIYVCNENQNPILYKYYRRDIESINNSSKKFQFLNSDVNIFNTKHYAIAQIYDKF
jgi:hypothetical protein